MLLIEDKDETMPESPANQHTSAPHLSTQKPVERFASPQELAEFGAVPPDPKIEAQILALLEAQMEESLGAVEPPTVTIHFPSSSTSEVRAVNEQIKIPQQSPAAPPPTAASPLPVFPGQQIGSLAAPEANTTIEPTTASAEIPREMVYDETQPPTETEPPHEPWPTDLLEFAEILDQHRVWLDSGGIEGTCGDLSGMNLAGRDLTAINLQVAQLHKTNLRGADLSMANLRGANLVEADLREANLLGAEFSGANLMGANLYCAQGLWAGRLGGTNLFDATLPESVAAHDGGKTIAQSTQSARRFYLIVISLCLAACGLVALTTDVRLLLDRAAVPSSRIPNFLPLQGFYMGAPLLLTILYFRLQFLLLRLWGSMGALPAVFPDGQTPEKDGSWYLMGPIRPHLRWSHDPRSPLAMGESTTAKLLAYWTVPATLFLFWLRYLVLQDYRGTLLQVFLFTLVTAAACALPRVVARVLRPGDWADESTKNFMRDVLSTLRVPAAVGLLLFLLSLGVIHGLPADQSVRPEVGRANPRRWAATAFQSVGYRPYADITEESVSSSPAKDFATEVTRDEAANGPRLNEMNLRYARGYRAAFANARMWRANLEGARMSEADFRGVNLREGTLRSAQLDRLLAAKANLVSVDGEWANLSGADFRSADLSFANLEGATLTTANFTRATLYAVNLRRANLLRVDLSHADVRDAKMEEASLSLATLEQTDLSAAKLQGANLTGAQIKGTILLEADLSRADLRGATMTGAILRQAKLNGALLDGADMRGALGVEAWQVCTTKGWQTALLDADVKAAADQLCGSPNVVPAPTPKP
jgi:uncharacterized protein YjbI with pentapeptide repeats